MVYNIPCAQAKSNCLQSGLPVCGCGAVSVDYFCFLLHACLFAPAIDRGITRYRELLNKCCPWLHNRHPHTAGVTDRNNFWQSRSAKKTAARSPPAFAATRHGSNRAASRCCRLTWPIPAISATRVTPAPALRTLFHCAIPSAGADPRFRYQPIRTGALCRRETAPAKTGKKAGSGS